LFKQIQEFDSKRLIPLGYKRNFAYKFLTNYFKLVFPNNKNKLLMDLAVIRLIEPTSKARSIELLDEYFGIVYKKTSLHRHILKISKDEVVRSLVEFARHTLNFYFSLVFYDVTTLYFESNKQDEVLKKPGFSKDGKHTQPQIMIGLVVDQNGFPIYFEIFKGNSFEGHTMLPIILDFKNKFNIKNLTVIADSAMLSENNLKDLESAGLSYIVGNRTITTYKDELNPMIEEMKKTNNSIRKISDQNRFVIYHFSKKRENKDDYEISMGTLKAIRALHNKNYSRSRMKYIKTLPSKASINVDLVEKHRLLAGIKSYKTNLDISPRLVVSRYSDLWHVEQTFRISKHDLKARPIFHRKEEAIRSHILIVFVAAAIAKCIEINTKQSINKVVTNIMKAIDIKFLDVLTEKEITYQFKPDISK